MTRDEVYNLISEEIDYAGMWDELPRTERPLRDDEKPVEFWLTMVRIYQRRAEDACYSPDKTEALDNIRKIAALLVRCMMNHPTPARNEPAR